MAVWNTIHLSNVVLGARLDAEYFTPQMMLLEQNLKKIQALPLSKRFPLVTYGTTPKGADWADPEEGVPFVRSQDFANGVVEEINQYCSKEHHKHNLKSSIHGGDVLIAAIGATIGVVGIYPTEYPEANTNQNIARVRLPTVPENIFLWSFLRSKYGKNQLFRLSTGNAQPYLNSIQIKKLLVPWTIFESFDSNIFYQFENKIRKSRRLYAQAQSLLESELGLDKLTFDKPVSYAARFSEVATAHRLDAGHYRPQYAQLIQHIKQSQWAYLGQLAEKNWRGVQPVYVEDGDVDVVNSQHLGRQHLDYDAFAKTTRAVFMANPEAHIRYGDILIYSTGAYVGRTNVYLRDEPALASNHVHIVRLRGDIDPAYMALVLSSPVGSFQTEKRSRGSAQAELYPSDIAKFVVPLLEPDKQKAIGDLVRESLTAQEESKHLLEQAKHRVENLIEEAIAA